MSFQQTPERPKSIGRPEDRARLIQLGLHVTITAYGLALLEKSKDPSILDLIEKTLVYFRRLSPVSGTILNEEPIYLAGEILGYNSQSLDDAPKEFWAHYHAIYSNVTREWATREELLVTIGRSVSGDVENLSLEFDVHIVPV